MQRKFSVTFQLWLGNNILRSMIIYGNRNALAQTLNILHPLKQKAELFHFFNLFFIPPYHQICPTPFDKEKSCFPSFWWHIAVHPKDIKNSHQCMGVPGGPVGLAEHRCCAWRQPDLQEPPDVLGLYRPAMAALRIVTVQQDNLKILTLLLSLLRDTRSAINTIKKMTHRQVNVTHETYQNWWS